MERLGADQALEKFHARLAATHKRQALVFVHGFNTRFGEAVFRLAQIAHDANLQAVPILFTWPSRGQLLAYTYDRESANYSRDALERLLRFLQQDPSVGEIDILAHSMGNWVTMEALRQMAIRDKGLAPRSRPSCSRPPMSISMCSAARSSRSVRNRPPFTLFLSRDDEALKVFAEDLGQCPARRRRRSP